MSVKDMDTGFPFCMNTRAHTRGFQCNFLPDLPADSAFFGSQAQCMSRSNYLESAHSAPVKMLEAFGILFQILGIFGLMWAVLVLYILIKYGHLKTNVAYMPAAGLAVANVGQLVLLICHLAPALYAFSIHGGLDDPCDGIFIILWYGSLGNVLVMAISRCWVTWYPTRAKYVFTLRRMICFCASGFMLGVCVAALPYTGVCCHFAFQISSKVIERSKTPETAVPANASIESMLSVNYSVVVPKSDDEYLIIIKTNNVLLLTHIIDFYTVFVSIVCYGLVFYKVRRHGNKITAQQQQNHRVSHNRSSQSSQVAGAITQSRSRRLFQNSDASNEQLAQNAETEAGPSCKRPHRVAIRHQHRGHVSKQITSTSDVRMLRRISVHFCLMSSAVMLFSVILLVVHRYPTDPSLVLLHQLFYVLSATVNSFLISTLNEKIRGDFRKSINHIREICCGHTPLTDGHSSISSGCCVHLCNCTGIQHQYAGNDAESDGNAWRVTNTTNATASTRANRSGSGNGYTMATFDLTQRVRAEIR